MRAKDGRTLRNKYTRGQNVSTGKDKINADGKNEQ
jgi:hypothetical protein